MIDIFNFPKEILKDKSKFKKNLNKVLKKHFDAENISIIFLDKQKIQDLNLKYREVNEPTDVLSFNYNTVGILGEVYVCTDYIKEKRPELDLIEEIYRITIHGILHLYGYDHKSEFIDINQPNLETMFEIQESMLNELLKNIK